MGVGYCAHAIGHKVSVIRILVASAIIKHIEVHINRRPLFGIEIRCGSPIADVVRLCGFL